MKSIILGISLASLLFGVLILLYGNSPVGCVVLKGEASALWGSDCYTENANASKVSVCSSTCGTRKAPPRISYSGGSSAQGIVCGSNEHCTYGGVGGSSCSGGDSTSNIGG